MKRLIIVFLIISMGLSLFACSGGKDENTSSESSTQPKNTVASTTAATAGTTTAPTAPTEATNEKFDANGKYIPLNHETVTLQKLTQWCFWDAGLLLKDGKLRSKDEVTAAADTIMKNIRDDGCNTVLMQMRPYGDSFYQSEYFPLSYFVTGDYSTQTIEYDVVEIMIRAAHKYNISFQAWFNPMRNLRRADIEALPADGDWLIQKWYKGFEDENSEYYQYLFEAVDGKGDLRLYLNLGQPETRELILNGVKEIMQKYNVDGMFMDDYFYPSGVKTDKSIDTATFDFDHFATIAEFRRDNVNQLVHSIYAAVKEYDPNLIYGISPNGDIEYAYATECADIYTWCSEAGYVDVMYPQFYYGILHGSCAIDVLADKWAKALTNKDTKLIPVITLHKAGKEDAWAITDAGKTEWQDYHDTLLATLTYLMTTDVVRIDGLGLYCYDYFRGTCYNEATKAEIDSFNFLWQKYAQLKGADAAAISALFTENGLDYQAKLDEWDDRVFNARSVFLFDK